MQLHKTKNSWSNDISDITMWLRDTLIDLSWIRWTDIYLANDADIGIRA